MSAGTVIALAAVPVLAAAALLTVIRMAKGPTTLNRVVAADVTVAIVIAALGLEAVVHRHSTTLPVILVLSLIGFAGSLSVARFVADRDRAQRLDRIGGRDWAESAGQRWQAPQSGESRPTTDPGLRPDPDQPADREGDL